MSTIRHMLRLARLLILLAVATVASKADAHWCNDLWISHYNILVRPATDTVAVPSSGSTTLEVYVQNNMGYLLPNFVLSATAPGYTVNGASGWPYGNAVQNTAVRAGTLMPTENAKFTVTIAKSGGGTLDVSALSFYVTFGGPQYGPGNGLVMMKKNSGSFVPPSPADIGIGTANDQARQLGAMGDADFGNGSKGLDDLMQVYCVGRASWSAGDSDTSKCTSASSSTCADASSLGTGSGDKYQYSHLWAATEMGARKSVLGARTTELRKRLQCGASDSNLGFAGVAMVVLGYLGEDAGARTYLSSKVTAGGDRGTIAKAALVLMGNAADMTTYKADLTAGLSSGNLFVSAACATALGIVARDDNAVTTVLIAKAQWTEPDTGDNGQGFYASNLLSLVAWDRRGWAFGGADKGSISFYGGTPPPIADPAAPAGPACKANADGSVRVTWSAVTVDVNGNGTSVTGYKAYSGTTARPGGTTKPGTGFDYTHADDATGTYRDYTGLDGTKPSYFAVTAISANGASAYSAEVTCTPTFAPVAKIACAPLTGTAPPDVVVTCDGNGSTDPNGTADITGYTFSLVGVSGSTKTTNPASFTISAPGNYDAQLVVKDKAGLASAPSTVTIAVSSTSGNKPPVAKATATPTSGTAPLSVSFSGAASSDPDGTIASYTWDFGDGTATATGATTTHAFQKAGTFTVSLSVTDNGSPAITSHTAVTVTVAGNSPVDLSTVSATPAAGAAPLKVHFDATGVTGAGLTFSWDFGDSSAKGTGTSADHTYAKAGAYTVTLTVSGGSAPATKTFTITVTGAGAGDAGVGGAGGSKTGAGGSAGKSDAGPAGPAGTGGAGGEEDVSTDSAAVGSCGCAVVGGRSALGLAALLALAAGLCAVRRRRNDGKS